jgi:hypothetical protein
MSHEYGRVIEKSVEHLSCYEVEVVSKDTATFSPGNTLKSGTTLKCLSNVVYITTHDPSIIYEKFGIDTVISIRRLGPAYNLPNGVP